MVRRRVEVDFLPLFQPVFACANDHLHRHLLADVLARLLRSEGPCGWFIVGVCKDWQKKDGQRQNENTHQWYSVGTGRSSSFSPRSSELPHRTGIRGPDRQLPSDLSQAPPAILHLTGSAKRRRT